MRSIAIGIGTIWVIFFTFIAMSGLITDALMYQEASIACNEAIYETELMLTEEEGSIGSNGEFVDAFRAFALPLLSHPEKYVINVYGADYKTGLLSVGIEYTSKHVAGIDGSTPRSVEVRRTMIIDEAR